MNPLSREETLFQTAAASPGLERHLRHEPVVARPPTAVYRFQRTFLRNRVIFVSRAGVALALILVVATVTS